MSNTNLKQLAAALGLSISSVSKALRDSYEISAETKKRVVEMATRMNYQPNPFASSLRRKKSATIGVVIPEIANNFFALAIDGIQMVAEQKGYHVLTYLTHENNTNEVSTVRHLLGGRVDGVLMSLCRDTQSVDHLSSLQESGIPLVFFDRVPEQMSCPTVTTDEYESGFRATEHLIQSGCKRIACLSLSHYLSISNKRMNGYMDALKKHGLPVENELIVQCTNDNEYNLSLIKTLLKGRKRPDGIFSTVEKLAISVYYVTQEMGLEIPKQLKIISFSNLRTASLLNPSLSTITQPAFEIGLEAAALLFRMIEKKTFGNRIDKLELKSALIERKSSERINKN